MCSTATTPFKEPAAPETLTYKRLAKRELRLFIEKPTDWKSTDRLPDVIFFFGGGWRSGSPAHFVKESGHLAPCGIIGIRAE